MTTPQPPERHCDLPHLPVHGSHVFVDPENGQHYLCHGHNEDGGTEHGTQGKVRIYCDCGLLMDTFYDNA